MGEDEAVAAIRAVIRAALDDPQSRAEVADLLTGATDARQRRLEELTEELAGYELTWGQKDGP
jgi:hypothetical protein